VPNFTAGTSFTDGVTNDVTAAKLNALVADAVPTSSLALTSTTGTISNFTASTANITLGTIPTLTAGTTTSTNAVVTNGTITNLSTTLAGDFTISQGTATLSTTGATAATYGTTSDIPRITVDAKGRITAASTVTAPVGFRNRIINGDMRIDQRNAGASQTFTAAAALAYSVDRFYGYCTGANVTGARVAGTAPNEFVYRYTGAASVTAIGFGTRLEATNTTDLAGSTATLSVQLANSLLTSVTWTAFYATTADAFGTLASPTRTQIATGTFTVTSTLTTYSAQISVPSAATTGIEIVFTVGAQTSGTWTIDNVQLEAGSTATDFERRPYGTELALCQRYYRTIGRGGAGTPMSVQGAQYLDADTVYLTYLADLTNMRALPTASLNGTANTDYAVYNSGFSKQTGFTFTLSSYQGFTGYQIQCSKTSHGLSNLPSLYFGSVTSSGFVSLSSEL
jgi:hypothetical protein